MNKRKITPQGTLTPQFTSLRFSPKLPPLNPTISGYFDHEAAFIANLATTSETTIFRQSVLFQIHVRSPNRTEYTLLWHRHVADSSNY
jgi:hypothetical protein